MLVQTVLRTPEASRQSLRITRDGTALILASLKPKPIQPARPFNKWDAILPFGRYKGMPLSQIAGLPNGLSYLDWLSGTPEPYGYLRKALTRFLLQDNTQKALDELFPDPEDDSRQPLLFVTPKPAFPMTHCPTVYTFTQHREPMPHDGYTHSARNDSSPLKPPPKPPAHPNHLPEYKAWLDMADALAHWECHQLDENSDSSYLPFDYEAHIAAKDKARAALKFLPSQVRRYACQEYKRLTSPTCSPKLMWPTGCTL
jgi:hypothetical protein